MFWADRVAEDLKKRKLSLEWVDDMKTPSGRIHVGGLRAVTTHDIVYKALVDAGIKAKFTYVFDNHDPMDTVPSYLPSEKYEEYLGMPLFMIPSPSEGAKNYAEYFAKEFEQGFNKIDCRPEIIWSTDLYLSGRMNDGIKKCLDNADKIRKIYEDLYKKKMPSDWYPFNVYCPRCNKVATTKAIGWDGKEVTFECRERAVTWTKGCGLKGKISPFATKEKINGKIPWKVEWAVKWQAIGITVEGAGKDHMTKGGSHDLAKRVAEEILKSPVPYAFAHEFFLVGGKKMSSSKGKGISVVELLEMLPPQLVRFLIVKTRINQAINFDPSGDTIPKLFDDYQKAANEYFSKLMLDNRHSGNQAKPEHPESLITKTTAIGDSGQDGYQTVTRQARMTDGDLARVFEMSQVTKVKRPPSVRFSILAHWVQMPNMEENIKKEGLEEWAKYAKVWVEKFAPESEKFVIQKALPDQAKKLSSQRRKYLKKIASELEKKWDAEEFQKKLYEWAKEISLSSKDAFAAIYLSLIGKDHGPKAAWLVLSLDKNFVMDRFSALQSLRHSGKRAKRAHPESPTEIRNSGQDRMTNIEINSRLVRSLDKPEIFSIDENLKEKFPSISIGIAIIKDVNIKKSDSDLEKEKKELLTSLEGLTTEQLGQYPEVQSYRKLYKATGIDWHSRRPSPEALLRRIALNKGLYTINTCVDAYNLIVMKHRVSIGAFDLDKIEFPTILRFAKKDEEILLLGDEDPTKYKDGEIAYFDKKGGYNIDFNYRDAQRTAVQFDTKNLYINVDGVFDITPQQVERSLKEACDMILKYCGGTIKLFGIENSY